MMTPAVPMQSPRMVPWRRRTGALLLVCLMTSLMAGCSSLAPVPEQADVLRLDPAETGLVAATATRIESRLDSGESAFRLLPASRDALDWRLALADHATRSIDIQYFIWQDDEVGNLLFDRLLRAADRGVRVRLLVDDLAFTPDERLIAAIDAHEHFDLRLFNPFHARGTVSSVFEYLAYFGERNRRMHNKLFVVDNRMAVVGGRNIGNEYFGLSEAYNFQDLDVLAAGPVVGDISNAFDTYWNAELAYPGKYLSEEEGPGDLDALRDEVARFLDDSRERLASYAIEPRDWSVEFDSLVGGVTTGRGHFLQDTPVEINGKPYRLADMIELVSEPAAEELLLVSPYFIPVEGLLDTMAAITADGVDLTLLTASMGSNNHTAAHSHYKKYRKRILDTGTSLIEFRHDPSEAVRREVDVAPIRAEFISLHVKAMVGDRRWSFIGSLNFDPRAVNINTENGLYVVSESLSAELADLVDALAAPENAWRVHYGESGDSLRWTSADGTVSSQPARSAGQRVSDFFLRLLPIESQL